MAREVAGRLAIAVAARLHAVERPFRVDGDARLLGEHFLENGKRDLRLELRAVEAVAHLRGVRAVRLAIVGLDPPREIEEGPVQPFQGAKVGV